MRGSFRRPALCGAPFLGICLLALAAAPAAADAPTRLWPIRQSGAPLEGKVDKVVVRRQQAGRLVLEVVYSDMPPMHLKGIIQLPSQVVQTEAVPLTSGRGRVARLEFSLPESENPTKVLTTGGVVLLLRADDDPSSVTSLFYSLRPKVVRLRPAGAAEKELAKRAKSRGQPGTAPGALPAPQRRIARRLLDAFRTGQNIATIPRRLPPPKEKEPEPEPESTDPAGPDPDARLNLVDEIMLLAVDDETFEVADMTDVSLIVYRDLNPASGCVYYKPRQYRLEWDPDRGYGFRMLYEGGAEGQAGRIMVTAVFESGVGASDVELLKRLLGARASRDSGFTYKKGCLQRLRTSEIDVSLAGSLGHFEVPAEAIVTNVLSETQDEFSVSWFVDEHSKAILELALIEDANALGGSVEMRINPEAEPESIPVTFELADSGSFGRFHWKRDETWRNRTPYPLWLRRMYALLITDLEDEADVPVVYAWKIEERVEPGEAVAWEADDVPVWLDDHADLVSMWIDYVPDSGCEACDAEVIKQVTSGVAARPMSIQISTITPLEASGAYEILVLLRSRRFDPRGADMLHESKVLREDYQEYSVGPIYLEDQLLTAADEPIFEYTLELTMPDGRVLPAAGQPRRWMPVYGTRLPIGKHQLVQVLGELPSGP